MNIVAIVGNGASIVYNPSFALGALTYEVLDRFSSESVNAFTVERTLSDLARAARTSGLSDGLSFEELLGPFDRMADGIDAMRNVARYVPGGLRYRDDLESATVFGRKLYRRSVGTALQVIAELSHDQGPDPLAESGKLIGYLADLVSGGGVVRAFTLNYDCLVDSAALELHEDAQSPICLSDMADGRHQSDIDILRSGDYRSASALPLRSSDEEYLGGPSAIVVYHLHGALDWVRDHSGKVWKIKSVDHLRAANFWHRYPRGGALVSPVVVLTDQKAHYIEGDPFAWAYRRLPYGVGTSATCPLTSCLLLAMASETYH